MNLKARLLVALAPLALTLLGIVSSVVTTRLGREPRLVLSHNYRSVLVSWKRNKLNVAVVS